MNTRLISGSATPAAVLGIMLVAGSGSGQAAAISPQGWNLNQQAAEACEQALTLQMGTESRASPDRSAESERGPAESPRRW
jgi:hypothetical protein